MSINKVEIQDSSGNVYYPHTDASVVKYGASDVGSALSENTQNIEQLSNPNLLINGRFKIRQRGNSFSYGAYNPKYTCDRWFAFSTSASSGSVITENGEEYFRVIGTPIGQIIEDLDLGTYTVSALVKSNVAQKYTISIDNANGIADRTTMYASNINIGTTWTKISYTFTITNKIKSYISISLGLTSTTVTSQFDIKWIKLELGSTATPFVPRLYGEELALCQRYYQKIYMSYRLGYTENPLWDKPVAFSEMRIPPSVTNFVFEVMNNDGTATPIAVLYNVYFGNNLNCWSVNTAIQAQQQYHVSATLDAEIY